MADTTINRVGPTLAGDGTNPQNRLGKMAELITQQAHGKYFEAVSRGNCYAAVTAATGVSVASLTISTAAPFALANPIGSGRRLALMWIEMGYVSGTFGAGNLVLALGGISGTAVSGTAIVPVNLWTGGGVQAVGKPLTTATLPAAPTVVRNFANLDAWVGSLTTSPFNIYLDLDSSLMLDPGSSFSVEGTTAAGTSPLVVFGCGWEEIPLI